VITGRAQLGGVIRGERGSEEGCEKEKKVKGRQREEGSAQAP